MTKSDVGELSLKVLAIYAFVYALASLTAPISVLELPQGSFRIQPSFRTLDIAVLFLPTVLLLLFSGFLWLTAGRLEHTPESSEPAIAGSAGITPAVLQNIAFSVTGILVLVGTLPLISNLTILFHRYTLGIPQREQLRFWINVAEILIRLVLGSWLIVGSNRIRLLGSRLLDTLRTSGE